MLDAAAKNLQGACFKLWVYCMKQPNRNAIKMTCKDFMNWASCSKPTCINAIKELMNKGYLVRNKDKTYTFFALPNS